MKKAKRLFAFTLCVLMLTASIIGTNVSKAQGMEAVWVTEETETNAVQITEEKMESTEAVSAALVVENTELPEEALSTESIETTEKIVSTEGEESTENIVSTESEEGTEKIISTEKITSTESKESTEKITTTESEESTEKITSTESEESTGKITTTKSKESTEKITSTESEESMENIVSTENAEFTASTEMEEQTENAKTAENISVYSEDIINDGDKEITVTIEHFDNSRYEEKNEENSKIYADDVKVLTAGSKITDYKKPVNWEIDHILAGDTQMSAEEAENISLTEDTVIKVFYRPTESVESGAAVFYDYVVKPAVYDDASKNAAESINAESNYAGTEKNSRFAVGTTGQNYSENQYDTVIKDASGAEQHINVYNEGTVKTGIVTGLTEDYKDVVFSVEEPGVFSNENKKGKTILNGYELQFKRTGDTYELTAVRDKNQKIVADNMSEFFPLDGAESNVTDWAYADTHNYYFGMRYDINFTIKDYTGDMIYSFTGDDDLWVILDGKYVIIDLGGIHNAIQKEVNLREWFENNFSEEERNEQLEKEHRLTVLYMERGGNASTCHMNFTLPNAKITEVEAPVADFSFTKVNEKGEALANAVFSLAKDGTSTTWSQTSNENGEVSFYNLPIGVYTLTETAAPDGYNTSEQSFKVIVAEKSDGVAAAELYESDGETPVPDNKIINYSTPEFVDTKLEYNKKATLTDWENREYRIDLSASSLMTSQTTVEQTQTVDVMMVFDLSGSMNEMLSGKSQLVDLGKYSDVEKHLDVNKVYYWDKYEKYLFWNESVGMDTAAISQNSYAKYPVKYVDGQWKKFVNNSWSAVSDKDIIATWDARLSALKDAASGFVTGISKTSPESKVGIATFYGEGDYWSSVTKGKLNQSLATVNQEKLIKAINELFADGGTAPQKGLQPAKNELQKAGDENKKYVILFTDGEPLEGEINNQAATENEAKELKEAGYTVITVGLGLTESTAKWLKEKVASKDCAFTAETAEELNRIFQSIQSTITQSQSITGAQITDVIEKEFEIPAEEVTRLEKEGAEVVLNEDGTTTVTWINQEIKPKKNGNSGWSHSILVVAKKDFIGGNNVKTNVAPDSFLSVGAETIPFEEPTVNVRIVYTIADAADTIFLGESLNDYVDDAALKIKTEKSGLFDLTLRFYTDEKCNNEISFDELKAQKPEADTSYYVNAWLTCEPSTEQSRVNSTIDGVIYENSASGVCATPKEGVSYAGKYDVTVKTGTLSIEKKISKNAIKTYEGDPVFTFCITNETTGDVYYKTLRFGADSKEDSSEQIEEGFFNVTVKATLEGLPQGIYRIEELSTMGFVAAGFTVLNTTNCKHNNYADVVKLAVGLKAEDTADWEADTGFSSKPKDGHLKADKAEIEVVNKKNRTPGKLTDTDVVKNSFVIGDHAVKNPNADNNSVTDVRK